MLHFAQTALSWVLPFLFVLTVVVTVHEFGHFLVAKACGVAIDRFSIGFGRSILSWRDRSGVEWRLGWIPLGGYVKFAGDDSVASVPDAEDLAELRAEILAREGPAAVRRYFHFKPIWQRALVVAAGPVANFVLSIGLFAGLLMVLGQWVTPPRIGMIEQGSPAAAAGFRIGDLVTRAAGHRVDDFHDLRDVVMVRAGLPTVFVLERAGREITLTATPQNKVVDDGMGSREPIGFLGVGPVMTIQAITHKTYSPLAAVSEGVRQSWDVLDTTLFYLGRVVRGQVSADQLSGPLGIAQMSHGIAQMGAEGGHTAEERFSGSVGALLYMAAVYSVGIGFMNLLPIPVLDGGHLLFYAYEAVARRPVGARVQAASYRAGLALLLGLMLFATTNDLQRSGVLHFLSGLFS